MFKKTYYMRPTYASIGVPRDEAKRIIKPRPKPRLPIDHDEPPLLMTINGHGKFPKATDAQNPGEQPSYQQRISALAEKAQSKAAVRPVGYGIKDLKPAKASSRSTKFYMSGSDQTEPPPLSMIKVPKPRKGRSKKL